MNQKWDKRFLELAKHISAWSLDPSTKVGAVVAKNKKVIGLGYNGFPKGVEDKDERYNDRELKYKLVVHAEVNACIMAGKEANGASLYVYPSFAPPPICNECCKIAIQMGIKEIVGYEPSKEDAERAKRWTDSIKLAASMLTEAGITWRMIKNE